MKQTRSVKAPTRTRLNTLTRQDLPTVAGGTGGTIIVQNLMGISGCAVVSQGVGGTGFLPDF